jgi:Acyltransferase family
MKEQRLSSLDWLKAVGLALIVYGHVAAWTSPLAAPPIYQKQIGVAFFVFATGFTLSRERTASWRVLYDRLFEFYMTGLVFALGMSVLGILAWSDPSESNYLPLAAGLQVLFDAFPANPTTWYIGTYIHLLLFWMLVLRRIRITVPMIWAMAAAEILCRAVLLAYAGRYIAYMFVGNWATLLTLGMWMGRRAVSEQPDGRSRSSGPWLAITTAVVLSVGWPLAMRAIPWQLTFPIMGLPTSDGTALLLISSAVSFVYVSYTLAAYGAAQTLPASALARFFARNTVFVVVAHMPVYYFLEWVLSGARYLWRVPIEFFICFVGLSCASELLRSYVDLKRLRNYFAVRLERRVGMSASEP